MSKDLGFGKGSKLDLTGFEPRTPKNDIEPGRADDAAHRKGFVSREAPERVTRRRKNDEPFDTAYVRAPLSVINKLKTYCNETGMSYGEALADLIRKAGL